MKDKAVSLLLNLQGVVNVVSLSSVDRSVILNLEENYESAQIVRLVNSGVRSVLKRDTVFAVLKDASFRNPPAPTVLMVEEILEDDDIKDNLEVLDGKVYRIVGEEIFRNGMPKDEEHISISSGFVLYNGRRANRENIPSFFLMPSIAFPELEAVKEELHIDGIVSASPSTSSDDYIREKYNLSRDNQLATILIGVYTEKMPG